MSLKKIDGELYLNLINAGAAKLATLRESINSLNVFPIPDGDTGDNMYMTIASVPRNFIQSSNLSETALKASQCMLLGARGNSGVILSQIFAGIAKGFEGLETASIRDFADAMQVAVTQAYSSVSNPVEGTILTVLKDGVNNAEGDDYESYFDSIIGHMKVSLDRTPDLLPVLKQAGVIDSGGAGLLTIFRGMREALLDGFAGNVEEKPAENASKKLDLDKFGPDSILEFGYCTEFLLRLQTSKVNLETFDVSVIRDYLNKAGESVVCFRDGSIVKVHVHTTAPGDIMSHCQIWGEFLTVKIENMTLQHNEITAASASEDENEFVHTKPYGLVAVAVGQGLEDAFIQAGADYVIEGGQTMNPSARSFIEAFDKVKAETIFVLPNNSNIILTARQAAGIYRKSKVIVLPCKDIGAGYVAAASMDSSVEDAGALESSLLETVASVTTGMVSKAIRDSSRDGISVSEGDYIGIEGGHIVDAAPSAEGALVAMAGKIGTAEHDVALLFYGNGTDSTKAAEVLEMLQKEYPRTEFMLTGGGQPVYDYILTLC